MREIETFVYLGCEIRKDGDIRNQVGIRFGKAGAAFRTMSYACNEDDISMRTKLKLLSTIVMSVLIYIRMRVKERIKRGRGSCEKISNDCLTKIMKIRW